MPASETRLSSKPEMRAPWPVVKAWLDAGCTIMPGTANKTPPKGFGRDMASFDPEVVKAWHSDSSYRSFLCLTGSESGLVVVDIDDHKPAFKPGHFPLESLESNRCWQTTINGGCQHLFRSGHGLDDLTTGQDACGSEGIDYRCNRGYVVIYEDPGFSGIKHCPADVADALLATVGTRKAKAGAKGSTAPGPTRDAPPPLTPDRQHDLQGMLARISPDCIESVWYQLIYAIRNTYGQDPAVEALARQWSDSSTGTRHKPLTDAQWQKYWHRNKTTLHGFPTLAKAARSGLPPANGHIRPNGHTKPVQAAVMPAVAQPAPPVQQRPAEPPVLELGRMSEVEILPTQWLWHHWLEQGTYVAMSGDAGTGKTTLAIDFAAKITGGGEWPDQKESALGGKKVLYWSDEEDIAVPAASIQAAGGDADLALFIKGKVENGKKVGFSLGRDVEYLCNAIESEGIALCILDPIISLASQQKDSYRDEQVRDSLAPLMAVAEKTGCLILGIGHPAKGGDGRKMLESFGGSKAWVNAARVFLYTVCNREDERCLIRVKSNHGPSGGGMSYMLQHRQQPFTSKSTGKVSNVITSRIEWLEFESGHADEINDRYCKKSDVKEKADDARNWLNNYLSGVRGFVARVSDIEAAAKADGMSVATIKQNRKLAGVSFSKQGNVSWWFITSDRPDLEAMAKLPPEMDPVEMPDAESGDSQGDSVQGDSPAEEADSVADDSAEG